MRRIIIVAVALASCGGEPSPTGSTEPIRVIDGTFKAGELPGSPPVDGGAPVAPDVATVDSVNNILAPGQASRHFSGLASGDASSVAVRLGELGTGYWVVVPGSPDPATPGQASWSMSFDVGSSVKAGLYPLRFAALDARGRAGTQKEVPVCVTAPVPDNYNSCDPTIAPPAAVLSLSWDTNVDLDLVVVTPSGDVVSPKHPTTAGDKDGGVAPDPKKDGVLDRDSNANCVVDGLRREDLVWESPPQDGTYLIYVSMFSACALPAARFTVALFVAEPTGVGKNQALVEKTHVSGELLAIDANAGATKGLYVDSFSAPFH